MRTLTTMLFVLMTLATNFSFAQSNGIGNLTKPCLDSATKSAINLYLIKGAEARELLNECQKNRIQDSIDRAECNRLLQVETNYAQDLKRDKEGLQGDKEKLQGEVRSLRGKLIFSYAVTTFVIILPYLIR